MKPNLKIRAREALEEAKVALQRDKHLIPVAYVLTSEGVLDFALTFEGSEQKQAVYRELIRIAKEKNATGIITINDSHCADKGIRRECLYVAVSGPGIETWSLCLFYARVGNEIVFEEEAETVGDALNLLPGWAHPS